MQVRPIVVATAIVISPRGPVNRNMIMVRKIRIAVEIFV